MAIKRMTIAVQFNAAVRDGIKIKSNVMAIIQNMTDINEWWQQQQHRPIQEVERHTQAFISDLNRYNVYTK